MNSHPRADSGTTAPPSSMAADIGVAAARSAGAAGLQVPEALLGTELSTGRFRIALRRDARSGEPLLEVRHADTPAGRATMRTVPGEPFLASADGQATISDRRGHIRVRDARHDETRGQTIDSMRLEAGRVVLEGTLARGGRRGEQQAPVGWRVEFEPADTERLRVRARVTSPSGAPVHDRIALTLAADPDGRVHGLGMQYTHVDLKGRRVPIVASEQGIGRGRQPLTAVMNAVAGAGGSSTMSYAPLPQFLTSDLQSMFLEQSDYAEFDLRRPDRITIDVHDDELVGQLVHGTSPKQLVSEYTEHTGRMRALPEWVHHGAIVSVQGGTDAVRGVARTLREAGVPVAGYWMQDWTGRRTTPLASQLWWNWELDQASYAGWDELRRELAADGARVLTYVNPMLVDVAERAGGARRNLYREAKQRGFLVRAHDGGVARIPNTTFSAGLIDLSNPQARTWIKQVIRDQVLATGVSGFMADYGEALPFDAVLHSGEDAAEWHNRYPDEWAKVVREAVREAGLDDEVVTFHRSAGGSEGARENASLYWSGDQLVTWDRHDGMRSALASLLSGGMSGLALTHSDTGGYTGIDLPFLKLGRSKELLQRWTELSAFTTMLRTHEGSTPRRNHQLWSDEATLAHFGRMASVYAALAPYRMQVVAEAAETGVPVVRHMWLEFPDDPVAGSLTDQFMLGSDVLVAPALDPGAKTVRAWVPAGRWTHLFTGEQVGEATRGSWVELPAPIGEPAVLLRAGSTQLEAVREELRRKGIAR